jgi:hypothetical protein
LSSVITTSKLEKVLVEKQQHFSIGWIQTATTDSYYTACSAKQMLAANGTARVRINHQCTGGISFLFYTNFQRMSAGDSLRLFKLLLTDQAADWLKPLPDYKKSSFDLLTQAFNESYALTRSGSMAKNSRDLVTQTRPQ